MKFQMDKNHVIDFLFPIALFFVFATSALIVVLLSANSYQTTTQKADNNYMTRTSISYVTEKIRQNDNGGQVAVAEFDGGPALVLTQERAGNRYCTYIYEHEGTLRELFTKVGVPATRGDGLAIMDVVGFSVEAAGDHMIRVYATDKSGMESSVLLGIKSRAA